jgi:hypothetical protein
MWLKYVDPDETEGGITGLRPTLAKMKRWGCWRRSSVVRTKTSEIRTQISDLKHLISVIFLENWYGKG